MITLNVPFTCKVNLHTFERHYSGSITLSPEHELVRAQPQTFYFLLLNPYLGPEAELSIFKDEQMTELFAEAIGGPIQGYDQATGRPITNFEFGLAIDDSRRGAVYVLVMIISEAVYQAGIRYTQGKDADKAEQVLLYDFRRRWEQTFHEETVPVAQSFLRSFGYRV